MGSVFRKYRKLIKQTQLMSWIPLHISGAVRCILTVFLRVFWRLRAKPSGSQQMGRKNMKLAYNGNYFYYLSISLFTPTSETEGERKGCCCSQKRCSRVHVRSYLEQDFRISAISFNRVVKYFLLQPGAFPRQGFPNVSGWGDHICSVFSCDQLIMYSLSEVFQNH